MKRLQHIYDLCKGKTICEGGDELDERVGQEGDDSDKKQVRNAGKPCF